MSVALEYRTGGLDEGPVLLLGGSLGTTLQMWEPQLAGIGGAARLVSFSQRGHGASPAPTGPYDIADLGGDVLALMDRLGLERASYCGLSIGGMVGQWLAINAPQRIQRLILICTSAHLPPAEDWRPAGRHRARGRDTRGDRRRRPGALVHPRLRPAQSRHGCPLPPDDRLGPGRGICGLL